MYLCVTVHVSLPLPLLLPRPLSSLSLVLFFLSALYRLTASLSYQVVLMSSLNYFGLKLVGWTAVGLVVMCLLPFIAFIIVGTPLVDTRKWYQTKPVEEIDVGLYLNTLFWNLNYFDSASTLAGEVENPTRTFPRALAMAVVLVVVVYLWPLAVAIGVSENVQFDLGFAGMNCTTGSPLHVLLTDETNTTWASTTEPPQTPTHTIPPVF